MSKLRKSLCEIVSRADSACAFGSGNVLGFSATDILVAKPPTALSDPFRAAFAHPVAVVRRRRWPKQRFKLQCLELV
eukprot:9923880-Alexandrium_andersonii.AAC.1